MASIEDLMNSLSGLGEQLDQIDLDLLEVGGHLVNKIKSFSDFPRDTGSLQNSVKSRVEKTGSGSILKIQQLYYGAFQNYGVVGTQMDRAVPVPFGVEPRPRIEPKYSFQKNDDPVGGDLPYAARLSIRRKGLRARGYFDLEELRRLFEEKLKERLAIPRT